MATISKTKKIESLVALLQKRYKNMPLPPERSVLEQLIYAALLENASIELADAAYAILEHYFIDWNEIRVSTVQELADTFSMLPDPTAAGERIRRALQRIFEKIYMFDLEDLRKKGRSLTQITETLESYDACSRFMIDYTIQTAFSGHVIPVDEAAMRVFRLLGLTQVNAARTAETVSGLERTIPKKNGPRFTMQLHQFAAAYFQTPESSELRKILKSIEPGIDKQDWHPPVLVVPKTKPPTPVKPPVASGVVVPFGVKPDDELDEELGGDEPGSLVLAAAKLPRLNLSSPHVASQPLKRETPGHVSAKTESGKPDIVKPDTMKPGKMPAKKKSNQQSSAVASQPKTEAASDKKQKSVKEPVSKKAAPPSKPKAVPPQKNVKSKQKPESGTTATGKPKNVKSENVLKKAAKPIKKKAK